MMTGELQRDRDHPDPSLLTTAQLMRVVASERALTEAELEVLRERLRGIDRATRVFDEVVTRVPTDVQREVGRLADIVAERFKAIEQQFRERDIRAEREARDNRIAVDAAFSAQKEAIVLQDRANQKAIDKAETATGDAINKLAQLSSTEQRAISDRLDDAKERMSLLESRIIAVEQQKVGGKEANTGMYAVAGFILVLLTIAGIIGAFAT